VWLAPGGATLVGRAAKADLACCAASPAPALGREAANWSQLRGAGCTAPRRPRLVSDNYRSTPDGCPSVSVRGVQPGHAGGGAEAAEGS
jgi:hypothetical protein